MILKLDSKDLKKLIDDYVFEEYDCTPSHARADFDISHEAFVKKLNPKTHRVENLPFPVITFTAQYDTELLEYYEFVQIIVSYLKKLKMELDGELKFGFSLSTHSAIRIDYFLKTQTGFNIAGTPYVEFAVKQKKCFSIKQLFCST